MSIDTSVPSEYSLNAFAAREKVIGNKGPLAIMLVITRQLMGLTPPYDSKNFLTGKRGQVKGSGGAATQAILKEYGLMRVLAEEGGRTSRGSINLMQAYLSFLNEQFSAHGSLDLKFCEEFWIGNVRAYFASKPFLLKLDPAWGIRTSVRHLTEQATARQKEGTGSMFLGTMMQHLVGAKLDLILGTGVIEHHSANQSDQKVGRHGDFDVEDVAIHVSTAPSEALIRKCVENLGKGKRPIIITTQKGMLTAEGLLDNAGISDRVDLIEFEQFIAANVFELGEFKADGRKQSFQRIIDAYNSISSKHETDPGLRIEMSAGK